MTAVRWVKWHRVNAGNPFGDGSLDSQLQTGGPGKLHAVAGKVGGYADQGFGETGKASCGVIVPADDPDQIAWWTHRGEHCKRCALKPCLCSRCGRWVYDGLSRCDDCV